MRGTYKAFFHQSSICYCCFMVFQIRLTISNPYGTREPSPEKKDLWQKPLGAAALPLGWALWEPQGPLGQYCDCPINLLP